MSTSERAISMLNGIRRRLRGEDGLSLVEMMIGILIIGFVSAATASSLISSFAAASVNESRLRASALANEVLENLQAIRWEQAGFHSGDFPYGSPSVSAPTGTVILPGTRPTSSTPCNQTVPPLPYCASVLRDGRTYEVIRSIVWVDNPSTAGTQDYKRLRVTVRWRDGGYQRQQAAEALRAPLPEEQKASLFSIRVHEMRPEIVYIDSSGNIDATRTGTSSLRVNVQTSVSASDVQVTYRRRGATSDSSVALAPVAGNYRNWTATLPGPFGNGDHLFLVQAQRMVGGFPETITSDRLVRFVQNPFQVRDLTLTPASACSEDPQPPIEVTFKVDGAVYEDIVRVSWGTRSEVVAPNSSPQPYGHDYAYTIPADAYSGSVTVTVDATRSLDGATSPSASTGFTYSPCVVQP